MHSAVRELQRLLPPPSAGVEVLSWGEVRAEWGTGFPRDYRDFMEVYGRGSIDNLIVVATPESRSASGACSPCAG
ncbi:hypothetical protein ACL02U_15135 [Streptomyces sp. MS06]|uniref:hypothetical protein n=1 Tax=Streptomyces sp. MS06 TaxID=3385974 RepID=UPI0039A32713